MKSMHLTRRRRLAFTALVLCVLGGGLWWSMHPQIDPKQLQGRWHGIGDDEVECHWSFYPRSLSDVRYSAPSYRISVAYEWHVRGSRLILFPQQRAPSASQNMRNWLSLIGVGRTSSCVYRIVEFDGDNMVLEAEKRVPNRPKSIKLTLTARKQRTNRLTAGAQSRVEE